MKKTSKFLLITLITLFVFSCKDKTEEIEPENRQQSNDSLIIDFPDSGLASAIREELGMADDQLIRKYDAESLTKLTATKLKISNLEGLEYCSNLIRLELSSNDITDLSPLSGLTSLTELSLHRNEIIDLSSLSTLTTLRLSENKIIDLSPLSTLTSLDYLGLNNNQIIDVNSLLSLDTLTGLHLNNNQIMVISSLESLSGLKNLSLMSQFDGWGPSYGLTQAQQDELTQALPNTSILF